MARTIGTMLLTAALIWLLPLSSLAAPEGDPAPADSGVTAGSAADPSYSGPLDPRTGLPADTGSSDVYHQLEEGRYGYDRELGRYVNLLGGESFTSSIPNGAVVSEGQIVSIELPSGMTGTLYCGGDVLEGADLSGIAETGRYLLEVYSSSSRESVSFLFQIVGSVTNALTELSLPSGFVFDFVNLNGEALTLEYANYLELIDDGDYQIRWSCPEIGRSYTLSFTLDTVPPVLELPEVHDGQARSEVTVADLEEGAYILLEQDGETSTITSAQTVIRDAGAYRLTVFDPAGNRTVYEFTIHLYLNVSAVAAIALILAGLAALWGYSRYIRTHPRVG